VQVVHRARQLLFGTIMQAQIAQEMPRSVVLIKLVVSGLQRGLRRATLYELDPEN